MREGIAGKAVKIKNSQDAKDVNATVRMTVMEFPQTHRDITTSTSLLLWQKKVRISRCGFCF